MTILPEKEGQETNGYIKSEEKHQKKDSEGFTRSGNSPPNRTRKPPSNGDRQEQTDEFLDVESVAKMLRVSENTIYSWVHQRKIPFYKLGRLVRFKRGEILEWAEKPKSVRI